MHDVPAQQVPMMPASAGHTPSHSVQKPPGKDLDVVNFLERAVVSSPCAPGEAAGKNHTTFQPFCRHRRDSGLPQAWLCLRIPLAAYPGNHDLWLQVLSTQIQGDCA